jgi:hypothetical protein
MFTIAFNGRPGDIVRSTITKAMAKILRMTGM